MNTLHQAVLLLALCCIGYVFGAPDFGPRASETVAAFPPEKTISSRELDALLNADGPSDNGKSNDGNGNNYDKRVERYSFGMGRRSFMNGGAGKKRLPVYNFGLGKRSRLYSFGLGKRGDYEEEQQFDTQENYSNEKRARPYSFGLGKRTVDVSDRPSYSGWHDYGWGQR